MVGISIDKVNELVGLLEKSQWAYKIDPTVLDNIPILTREALQTINIPKGSMVSRTSGSTGEPVTVPKSTADLVWHMATNLREINWLGWDTSLSIAAVTAATKSQEFSGWGFSNQLLPKQGHTFSHRMDTINVLQEWLEQVNPHYLHTMPTILELLDTSKLTNFIAAKTVGEAGANSYSSSECGTIALKCPDNSQVYHVMENILVEREADGNALITVRTNPYIKRYRIGDYIELGVCGCGRTLQTISKIYGRKRNMMVMPNGDRKWPLIGSPHYYERFGIKRFQIIQESMIQIVAKIQSTIQFDENEFKSYLVQCLDYPFEVQIQYVSEFPMGKFEEFICKV